MSGYCALNNCGTTEPHTTYDSDEKMSKAKLVAFLTVDIIAASMIFMTAFYASLT